MTLSRMPLSYCTNVHPGRSLAEVQDGLTRFMLPIRERFGEPLAAGLWLSRPVIDELQTADTLARFADFLRHRDLPCYTLNAFPYGDFHSDRVKEQVYLPDWTHPDREQYTLNCARVLTALLPDGVDGSLSTVPLGFKALATSTDFLDRCLNRLIATATGLARLRDETGRTVRLAIEPEPLCVLETTDETVAFFQQLRDRADGSRASNAVREHLGVCYDVCHQSVEFEDIAASIRQLVAADIRINKVHISCAIEARNPTRDPAVREALLRYVEPRYLHQTFARTPSGARTWHTDLDRELVMSPSPEFAAAEIWRVHFHVPVDAERLGPLGTTRADLQRALAVLPELKYAPHLEVETYTWEVLPDGGRTELVEGFARELRATRTLLNNLTHPNQLP
ncbi:MAG: metabolite traffic protein EboE [Planctomycetaceae bacterium]|nr:metabolite traffic protein EboE [Planctomycetaceae bacterium]